MSLRLIILSLLLLVQSPQLLAQTGTNSEDEDKLVMYVTDQLKLSLYNQAEASSGVIQLLSSGDALEIDEISGAYALVTTEEGKKGWVKKGFLVDKPTSNLLLKQELEKTKALDEEVQKLKNSKIVIDQYESDMDVLSGKLRVSETKQMEYEQVIKDLEQQKIDLITLQAEQVQQAEVAAVKYENPVLNLSINDVIEILKAYWQAIVPFLLALVLISFLLGKKLTEARIQKHFQGVKVW